MRWFNPNPYGRNVDDCAVRALCAASGISWGQARVELDVISYSAGTMSHSDDVWGAWLLAHGYQKRFLPNSCLFGYTVGDFALDHPRGVYVLKVSGHVVCVRDGEIWDSWDSSREIVTYYFERVTENELSPRIQQSVPADGTDLCSGAVSGFPPVPVSSAAPADGAANAHPGPAAERSSCQSVG